MIKIKRIKDFSFFKKVIQWQINLDIAAWNFWYPKEKIRVITEKEYEKLNGKKKSTIQIH